MKLIVNILITVVIVSCQHKEAVPEVIAKTPAVVEVPNVYWTRNEVFFDTSNSTWLLKHDSSRVSGFVKEFSPSGSLFRSIGLVNGKKEGVHLTYYSDGRLRCEETYRQNRLHGQVRRWSLHNGYQLVALLQYRSGKPHGEQKKWYNSGELHKLLHLNEGREEGLQQAFRKNGALYANYEAKNGRIFGMKKSNLCYELDNEQIVFEQ